MNHCGVLDSYSFPAEKTEVGRDAGRSSQEGDHRLRSAHSQTGLVLHSGGQQNHCQDARGGKGKRELSETVPQLQVLVVNAAMFIM